MAGTDLQWGPGKLARLFGNPWVKHSTIFVVYVVLYGFLLPYMISQNSDLMVILGFLLVFVSILFLVWFIVDTIKRKYL